MSLKANTTSITLQHLKLRTNIVTTGTHIPSIQSISETTLKDTHIANRNHLKNITTTTISQYIKIKRMLPRKPQSTLNHKPYNPYNLVASIGHKRQSTTIAECLPTQIYIKRSSPTNKQDWKPLGEEKWMVGGGGGGNNLKIIAS